MRLFETDEVWFFRVKWITFQSLFDELDLLFLFGAVHEDGFMPE